MIGVYKITCFLIITSVLISGCTTRFNADFEADTAGLLPDPNPAGPPDDRIFVLDFESLDGTVEVSPSGSIDGDQSLRLSGPTASEESGNKVVFMYAERITSSDQRLYAFWAGRITSNASTKIRFFAGHFSTLVELEFSGGSILVEGRTIGTYTANRKHNVLLNVNPITKTYDVSVVGAVSGGASATGSIPNPSDLPTESIGLSFILTSGSASDSYTIDSVHMSERTP